MDFYDFSVHAADGLKCPPLIVQSQANAPTAVVWYPSPPPRRPNHGGLLKTDLTIRHRRPNGRARRHRLDPTQEWGSRRTGNPDRPELPVSTLIGIPRSCPAAEADTEIGFVPPVSPPASAVKFEAGLRVCPRCKKPVHLGAATCRECGTPVPRQ